MNSSFIGARNLISDVKGIKVGHSVDKEKGTGVSVIIPEKPAYCAADLRGGAPGSAETELLKSGSLVGKIDALMFSGGSVFGLAAHSGVVSFLRKEKRGFKVGNQRMPIVPSAVLFDLPVQQSPLAEYNNLGFQAAMQAKEDFSLGNHGAGLGARAGLLKGGVGSASLCFPNDKKNTLVTIGAYAAVNSFGNVIMPQQGCFWAWPFEREGEFGDVRPQFSLSKNIGHWAEPEKMRNAQIFSNTTLAVIATDMYLTPEQARRVAIMAQDGMARAIRPCHTPFDGDQLFVLSVGEKNSVLSDQNVLLCGLHAADCLARAVARAVYEASSLGKTPSWQSLYGEKQGNADV